MPQVASCAANRWIAVLLSFGFVLFAPCVRGGQPESDPGAKREQNVAIPHVSSDQGIRMDYDIVYVRAATW